MPIALPKLLELIQKANKRKPPFHGTLLAVDPGETTGVTVISAGVHHCDLVIQDQLTTWPIEQAVHNFTNEFQISLPTHVVFESYYVYSWRLQEHKFNEVPTIQIIGCLKTLCIQRGIPYDSQNAQTGKAFFTDDMLKKLNMYYEGQPHARDSLRHACQFLMFGTTQK